VARRERGGYSPRWAAEPDKIINNQLVIHIQVTEPAFAREARQNSDWHLLASKDTVPQRRSGTCF
jgi:hypothetical protein